MSQSDPRSDLVRFEDIKIQIQNRQTVFNSDEIKALLNIIEHLDKPLPHVKDPLTAEEWNLWLAEHTSHLWKAHYTYNEGLLITLDVYIVANRVEDAQGLAQIWADETSEEGNKAIITKIELIDWTVLFSSHPHIVRPTPPPHG